MVPVGQVNIHHHVEFGLFFSSYSQNKEHVSFVSIFKEIEKKERKKILHYINSVFRGSHWGIHLFLFLWVYIYSFFFLSAS